MAPLEPLLPNPVAIAEFAVDKASITRCLMPVISQAKALNELPDEMWTKIKIEFYGDPADAVFKALED